MHYRNAQTLPSTQSSEYPPSSPHPLQLESISATLNEMIGQTKEVHMKKLEIKQELVEMHTELRGIKKEFKEKLEKNTEIKEAMEEVNVQRKKILEQWEKRCMELLQEIKEKNMEVKEGREEFKKELEKKNVEIKEAREEFKKDLQKKNVEVREELKKKVEKKKQEPKEKEEIKVEGPAGAIACTIPKSAANIWIPVGLVLLVFWYIHQYGVIPAQKRAYDEGWREGMVLVNGKWQYNTAAEEMPKLGWRSPIVVRWPWGARMVSGVKMHEGL